MVGLLLLLIWLPCTVHCQAEALGWLGSDPACCHQGHADHAPAPDCSDCATCSSIESGGYSLPSKVSFVHALLTVVVFNTPDLLSPDHEPVARFFPAPDSSPQWLRQSWSFHCRTAPAPRAPSLLA